MMRQAIQIVGTSTPDGDADLFALCNDGTIWGLGHSGQWVEMPAIPQDESKDPLATLYAKNVALQDRLTDANNKLSQVEERATTLANNYDGSKSSVGREMLAILEIEHHDNFA